jgi:hypothetical protein
MAIKVNSTTVINDSRALQNISSVDSATVTALNNAGVGGSSYANKTANYTASAGDLLTANTTGGAFTITLPSSPSAGDSVGIIDVNRSWVNNSLTVAASGKTITDERGITASNSTAFNQSKALEFIYRADGAWYFKQTVSGEFPSLLFIPSDWTSPDVTLTGSGTWTAPSSWREEDIIVMYLTCGASQAAAFIYSGQSWQPGGTGGSARFFIGNVADFNGGAYVCGTGGNSTSWNRQPLNSNQETKITDNLGVNTYTALVTGSESASTYTNIGQIVSTTNFTATSASAVQDSYMSYTQSTVNPINTNEVSLSVTFGNRDHDGSGQNPGVVGPSIFSGGNGRSNGFGVTSAAGSVSLYSGNGGASFGANGTYPGGAGGGPTGGSGTTGGTSANGNIRIYRQPQ